MPLQVLIFILLFGLLQGLLIFFILLRRKNINAFHVFLSSYVVVLLFQIALKSVSKIWVMELWSTGYSLSYYFPFLYGPLVYFIARSSSGDYKFRPKHLLHFLPFAFFLLLFSLNVPNRQLPGFISYLFSPMIRLIFQIISLVAYHLAAINISGKFKNQQNSFIPAHISFVKKFAGISLGITTLMASTICFMYLAFPNYQFLKWSFALVTLFIYWISLTAFQKPNSFEVVFVNHGVKDLDGLSRSKLTVLHQESKYVNSGLKEEHANKIINLLNLAMQTQQLFLDSELTIDKLSEILGCHKHHLSQVLNDNLGMSFNEYINTKRVEVSKEMLSNQAKNPFTIASIAYDAGFNSLSTFNDVFKKMTGFTPSHYRKMTVKESLKKRI